MILASVAVDQPHWWCITPKGQTGRARLLWLPSTPQWRVSGVLSAVADGGRDAHCKSNDPYCKSNDSHGAVFLTLRRIQRKMVSLPPLCSSYLSYCSSSSFFCFSFFLPFFRFLFCHYVFLCCPTRAPERAPFPSLSSSSFFYS